MIFLQSLDTINIFEYIMTGSPYGISVLFLFLYLQEKKYSRELTQKTTDLIMIFNNFKEKIESQHGSVSEISKIGIKIDQIVESIKEVKRIIEK